MNLKKEFIRLLKEDEEFRYTVAGYIGLREILERLDRVEEELKALREEQISLRKEQIVLREDFNKMLAILQRMNQRLTRLERTVEKMTIDVEEEARSFVKHGLKQRGIEVEIDSLTLPEAEINIYGANGEICVIGEGSGEVGQIWTNLDKFTQLPLEPHCLRSPLGSSGTRHQARLHSGGPQNSPHL